MEILPFGLPRIMKYIAVLYADCARVHVFHEQYLRCGNKGSLGKSVVIFNQVFEICTHRTLKKW